MGGRIDAYLDVISPYSYFALKYLVEQQPALDAYGIELEFHPVFLGGINVATGNKPPWTLPAKGRYAPFDRQRACDAFGVPYAEAPKFFPFLSIFPQRTLLVIKARHAPSTFAQAWVALARAVWEEGQDVSQPDILTNVLRATKLFSDADLAAAVKGAADADVKAKLTANTEAAVKRGAFGCPWFWVRNAKGAEEPFFGSDRFNFMFRYLDLPVQELGIRMKDGHVWEPAKL